MDPTLSVLVYNLAWRFLSNFWVSYDDFKCESSLKFIFALYTTFSKRFWSWLKTCTPNYNPLTQLWTVFDHSAGANGQSFRVSQTPKIVFPGVLQTQRYNPSKVQVSVCDSDWVQKATLDMLNILELISAPSCWWFCTVWYNAMQ